MGGKATKEQRERWLAKPGNRERAREKAAAYRKSPVGRGKNAAAAARRRIRNGHRMLVEYAKARAAKRGIPFSLPPDWNEERTCCEWSGIPFIRGHRLYAASIDRINNTEGYTPENCRLVLRGLNVFKNDASSEEVETIVLALVKHRRLI